MALARFLARFYYRVERAGSSLPAAGPVLLVGNHPNGLVDPVLLASATPRTVRFVGKAPLFELPILGSVMRGLRVLPVYRPADGADVSLNEATFAAVHAALAAGDVVCLFPEGKSHDEPLVQKLKTGAARMALGAEAGRDFELGVRIVPVGLVYRAKRRFRSPVATWVGAPIEVRDLAPLFERDHREAVRLLTERIAEGLREVTLSLDRWEDLRLLELAERIFPPDERDRLERLKAFADGVHVLRARGEPRIEELAARIAAFRDRLERLGIPVDDLGRRYRPPAVLRFALLNLARLLIGLPLALVGAAFWALPYRLIPWFVQRLSPNRDIHATYQILGGVVFFPLWLILASVALGIGIHPWVGVGFALLAPALGLFALAFLEWRREVTEDVRVFLRLGLRTSLHNRLLKERDAIAREIGELRAEFLARREPNSTASAPKDG